MYKELIGEAWEAHDEAVSGGDFHDWERAALMVPKLIEAIVELTSEMGYGDLVTPCCGAELLIVTEYQSRGYGGGTDVPSEILCAGPGCYEEWTPQGKMR